MKEAFGAIGCAVAAVLGIVVLVVGGYAVKYYTADVRGRIDANETIKSGDSRIANYNHFFNLCASVQTNEAQLDALSDQLRAQTPGTPDYNRVLTNITGVRAARAGAINQYNADASKSYTQGQFLSSKLPYQLPTAEYSGAKTVCAL